jgi:hypothetical protein
MQAKEISSDYFFSTSMEQIEYPAPNEQIIPV